MTLRDIWLTLAVLAGPSWASSELAPTQDDAQVLVDQANTGNSNDVSGFVGQFYTGHEVQGQLVLDAEALKQAEALIDVSENKMNDPLIKQQAKALVSQSERYVGRQKYEDSNLAPSELTNGIDIGALIAKHKNPFQEKEDPTGGKKLPTLMVFISASLSPELLHELAIQTKKAGGVMVLNGFIDGKLSNTILYMKKLIEDTEVMINIDPTMFELYQVKSVPEIIVTSEPLKPCSPDKNKCEYIVPTHDRMKGNVTLYYALEQFSWEGDASSTALEHLGKLQSGQWNTPNEVN